MHGHMNVKHISYTLICYWFSWNMRIETVKSQPECIEATAERMCQFAMRTFPNLLYVEASDWEITITLQLSPSVKTGVNYLWHRKLPLNGGSVLDKIAE
jgi:hypothetical protein